MDVRVEDTVAGVVIQLSGHFDAAAVADTRPLLEDIPQQTRGRVFVDLSGVLSMDSAAIGLVAYMFKRLAAQQRMLLLVGPTGQPKRLLELLRIDRVIDILSSVPATAQPSNKLRERKSVHSIKRTEAVQV